MNNFKKITCPDCGDKGWILKDDPKFGNHRIDCPTCKGTPKKTIKITEVEYKQIGSEHGVNVYYEVIP